MLPTINHHAAGIDAGSTRFFVATPEGVVASFESHTAELYRLRDHLQQHGVTTVAIEATGVYWLCLYDILAEAKIEVCVVNGADVKALPGRKSDVQDCQWLQQLHAHGLLRASFVPPDQVRALRSYVRLRDDHIRSAGMYVQLMQKALDQLNVKLHTVISQLNGVSGLAIVRAILAGERNAAKLAALCDARILSKKRAAVEHSLAGRWKDEHLFALRQALAGWEFCEAQVKECDAAIGRQLDALNAGRPPGGPATPPAKTGRHHVPDVPGLHSHLLGLHAGHDATVLPGFTDTTWLKLTAELGTDLSRWPNEKAFCSWLALSPGKNQSGGRQRRARRRPKTTAGQIFRLAAQSVGKSSHLALGGFYRRIRARSNAAVATVATARKIAILFYRAMRQGLAFVERGLAAYEAAYRERQRRYLTKAAAELGLQLIPTPQSN
jgi:transposase